MENWRYFCWVIQRSGFKQYISSRPNRYGIKRIVLADAKIYYCSNLNVGFQSESSYTIIRNSTKSVIERLVKLISGTGWNVTVARWLASKELDDVFLKTHKLTLVGTIKTTKKKLLLEFLAKSRCIGASMFAYQSNDTFISFLYSKKKQKCAIAS